MIVWLAGCSGPPVLSLDDPRSVWAEGGDAVQVVPAGHLPSGEVNRDATEVWVTLPPGGELATEVLAGGRLGLSFPPGTSADRVEWRGDGDARRIVDVRGTTLEADGPRSHHVWVPVRRDPDASLVGVSWPAGDLVAADEALDALVAAVAPHRPEPAAWEQQYRSKHGCDACHTLDRPDNLAAGDHGLVNRGTDGQGWFTPSTVLAPDVPVETYGAWRGDDLDPYIVRDDGPVPRVHLDVARGLAAADPHTLAHCRSVAWVVDHLRAGDPARERLAAHPCLDR